MEIQMDKKEEEYHELVKKLVERGVDLTKSKDVLRKADERRNQAIAKVPILEQEVNRLKRRFWFENDTLFIRLIDGGNKALTVDSNRGDGKMIGLLKVCLYSLKEDFTIEKDGWVSTVLPFDKIIQKFKEFGVDNADKRVVRWTRNHLSRKIEEKKLQSYILLTPFDKDAGGYIFKINLLTAKI